MLHYGSVVQAETKTVTSMRRWFLWSRALSCHTLYCSTSHLHTTFLPIADFSSMPIIYAYCTFMYELFRKL